MFTIYHIPSPRMGIQKHLVNKIVPCWFRDLRALKSRNQRGLIWAYSNTLCGTSHQRHKYVSLFSDAWFEIQCHFNSLSFGWNSTTSPNGERRGVREGQDGLKFDDVTEWREERRPRGQRWAEIRRRHRMARGEETERAKVGWNSTTTTNGGRRGV